jgi:hypothetical protein
MESKDSWVWIPRTVQFCEPQGFVAPQGWGHVQNVRILVPLVQKLLWEFLTLFLLLPLRKSLETRGKRSQVWWLTPVIPATWEAGIGRVMIWGQPQQSSEDPLSKINRAKRTGGVTQAVEHLPCKCKALSSHPRPTKNNDNDDESRRWMNQIEKKEMHSK